MSLTENGRWGFIDSSGTFVIEPRFLYAESFRNGIALVYFGGHWKEITDAVWWRSYAGG